MLISCFITVQGEAVYTQVQAETIREAIRTLLAQGTIADFFGSRLPELRLRLNFSETDIVLFTTMEGLTNLWLCQVGRDGVYASIVLAPTVEHPIHS
jgi:hypothetical protein